MESIVAEADAKCEHAVRLLRAKDDAVASLQRQLRSQEAVFRHGTAALEAQLDTLQQCLEA